MEKDKWGKDPSVQAMRRVFSGMEACLGHILERLSISPYDQRIRTWLETALPKFEKAWYLAHQSGVETGENEAPLIYAHCLAKVMASAGVQIPDDMLPKDEKFQKLINEVFK